MITEIGPGTHGLYVLMFPILLIFFIGILFFVVHATNLNKPDEEEIKQ